MPLVFTFFLLWPLWYTLWTSWLWPTWYTLWPSWSLFGPSWFVAIMVYAGTQSPSTGFDLMFTVKNGMYRCIYRKSWIKAGPQVWAEFCSLLTSNYLCQAVLWCIVCVCWLVGSFGMLVAISQKLRSNFHKVWHRHRCRRRGSRRTCPPKFGKKYLRTIFM